jgi:hypothetical protein
MRRVALRPSASAQSAAAMNHVAKFCTLLAATYLVARYRAAGISLLAAVAAGRQSGQSGQRQAERAERAETGRAHVAAVKSVCAPPALRCSRRHGSAAKAIMLSTSSATGWIAAPFCHGAEKPPSD